MKLLTETNVTLFNLGILLLRATIGIIFFGIGAGKVFGWFGLPGLEMTLQFYANMGIPAPLAYLSIFTEFIGGFLLIVGLLTSSCRIRHHDQYASRNHPHPADGILHGSGAAPQSHGQRRHHSTDRTDGIQHRLLATAAW
jgi:DoxX